jgi:Domain of unknown function (DUF1844)
MAEVQTTTESGEMAQRFIELVMMQAQNAAFALGQIPHPETGEAPVNLELARLFIDQLIVLRNKTRNNLSSDEQAVLNNAISNLQMVFVEVSQGGGASAGNGGAELAGEPEAEEEAASAAATPGAETPAVSQTTAATAPEPSAEESRKKFTKSYGS